VNNFLKLLIFNKLCYDFSVDNPVVFPLNAVQQPDFPPFLTAFSHLIDNLVFKGAFRAGAFHIRRPFSFSTHFFADAVDKETKTNYF